MSTILKNKTKTHNISFYLSISVISVISILLFCLILNQNTGTVSNLKDRMSENTVTINLKGGSGVYFNENINYNDEWFQGDNSIYNHNLALSSLYVSLSTFSSGNVLENWGENVDNIREVNLRKTFEGLSFKNIEFDGYSSSLNNTQSKTAFGIAMKKYYKNNLPCNVVCIALRSGGYGCEWSDNFNVGDDSNKFHKGFYDSAVRVKEYAEDYVKRNCRDEEVRFWICGYSRGGAVGNILATLMPDKRKVYAYTFATPNTVCDAEREYTAEKYPHIFNILNSYDPVITLPPNKWGFGKVGKNMYFPDQTNASESLLKKVSDNYFILTGSRKDIYSYTAVSRLMNVITSFVANRNIYKKDFQDVFYNLATATMTKVKIGGEWKRIDYERYLNEVFSDKSEIAINEYEKSQQYKSMETIGLKVPESIRQLDIMLRIHGFESPEKLLFESMTLDSVADISSLSDTKSFTDLAIGHYPEVYISWMKSIDEKDFILN